MSGLFADTHMAPPWPRADTFPFQPTSILDARAGAWQDRKRAWTRCGIKSELGRHCDGSYGWQDLANHPRMAESGKKMAAVGDGPSIFDPVLCEAAYAWWSPRGGQVVDPFAGGSVRGIVAAAHGRRYWGSDLGGAQVAANREQSAAFDWAVPPVWVHGDSTHTLAEAPLADYLFSCPPYGDLEKYSDDPADLSAMPFEAFVPAYYAIITAAVARLRDDRFAAWVVGDFRDKRTGINRGFVGHTIAAFAAAGMRLHDEAILVLSVGSASMRATQQFRIGRKLCRTHQNLLVFLKGDAKRAAEACR